MYKKLKKLVNKINSEKETSQGYAERKKDIHLEDILLAFQNQNNKLRQTEEAKNGIMSLKMAIATHPYFNLDKKFKEQDDKFFSSLIKLLEKYE